MDQWLLQFISENWLTLTLALMFIKGIAEITPGKADDKIAELFSNMLNFVRKGKK